MLSIRPLYFHDEVDCALWRDYVEPRLDSHCSDQAEWPVIFREVYGFEHRAYLCLEEGRTVGALLLYHIPSPFVGRMLVTCPFFGHGGLYWESESARDALLERAEAAARELGVDYIEIRHRERLPHPYQANPDFAEYDLALGATPQETWKAVEPNVRQNVRKSQAADLEFRMVTDWAATYRLLCRTLRAHGTPFHGERFFSRVFARLGRSTRFSEVWHAGKLVAAGIAIQYKDSMITPYIGSLERSRELRANYRQYWGLIEEHCLVQGIRRFEMGRSPRGSTHAQFKQKWGAKERQLHYNYLVINPRRGYRSVSRPSAVQRLATQVWRRLPLFVTKTLGPRLFRYIP